MVTTTCGAAVVRGAAVAYEPAPITPVGRFLRATSTPFTNTITPSSARVVSVTPVSASASGIVNECRNCALSGRPDVGGGTSTFVTMPGAPKPNSALPVFHARSSNAAVVQPAGQLPVRYCQRHSLPGWSSTTGTGSDGAASVDTA